MSKADTRHPKKEVTAAAIAEFLDTRDDFDLELFAYRSLADSGWGAHHGGTYHDPVTEKLRQYDVWARNEFAMHCDALLAVECKSLSPEFPLVVSRVPRHAADARHDLIKTWLRPEVGDTATVVESSQAARVQLYAEGAMVGKATTQVRWHDNGKLLVPSDADTYDKWSQALASATHLVVTAATAKGLPDGKARYSFIMPVLVVSDRTLWVVDYNKSGKREAPMLVDRADLYVDRGVDLKTRAAPMRYHLRHLHICTRTGFVQLLAEFGRDGGLWELLYGWAIRAEAKASG
jgi:hypothetical protein